jgi:drug/metabolite transporter (DMT)-like permease
MASPFSFPNLCGLAAIGLWSLLALFTVGTAGLPPFQVTATAFALASLIGGAMLARGGEGFAALRQPLRVWALGVYGLFGFHALYFSALKLAPPAEAGLISYLWPLLIVLFSALLPGESLSRRHVLAGALGFLGVIVMGLGKGGLGFEAQHWPGYLAALGCAVIWSSYSVLTRLQSEVPTGAVTGFCVATALLSLLCHLAFETTVAPAGAIGWLSLAALGLGPTGAAFYLWDKGMKQGDIRLLGLASYATPVLSTLVLVVSGHASPHWSLALACLLIAGAAAAAMPRKQT